MNLEPANSIIEKCGGPVATARYAGISHASVCGWRTPVAAGGTGGYVPRKHIPNIIENAGKDGIHFDWSEFYPPPEDFVHAAPHKVTAA